MPKWSSTKPWKMWIDGKCFIISPYDKFKRTFPEKLAQTDSGSCTNIESNYVINPTEDGKLATKFRLPPFVYKLLPTFPRFSIKHLEEQTQTEIIIPASEEVDYLTISGKSKLDIINAREFIHSVVGEIRGHETLQQFISIPVLSEEIQSNFEKFKTEILSTDEIEGVEASIFQSPLKLHLTVAVFSLMDCLEINEGIAALNDCKAQIIEPVLKEIAEGSLTITVTGIDCMTNNLSKVNVLYAKAKIEHEKEDILQTIANNISGFFYDRGLIRQYQDNVKLHVTLMNTKYRKNTPEKKLENRRKYSKWNNRRLPFDARSIIEKYKDYYFGKVTFNCVHLSHMSTVGEDGFYQPLSVITF